MKYLACPYSDPNPFVREARFRAVAHAAARLMAQDELVFCPITYSHPIQTAGRLQPGWAFWSRIDRWALAHCDEVVVLTLPGWDRSEGVRAECDYAIEHDLPISLLEPSAAEMALVLSTGDNPQPRGEADVDG